MLRFYDEIPEMTFFAGDTLPTFTITVDRDNLEDCEMQIVISRLNPSKNAIIRKNCISATEGFMVQLTSSETKNLTEGTYRISFVMTDKIGLEYIKLSGLAYVRRQEVKMEFVFKIDSSLKFDIKKLPEKEYIEKEITPCIVSFSAEALFADLVLAIFRTEEEEELISGN